jgi:hypothetical protein
MLIGGSRKKKTSEKILSSAGSCVAIVFRADIYDSAMDSTRDAIIFGVNPRSQIRAFLSKLFG